MNAAEHRAEAEKLLQKTQDPGYNRDRLIALAQLQMLMALDGRLAEFMERPYGGGQS